MPSPSPSNRWSSDTRGPMPRFADRMRRFSSSQASKGTLYDDDVERGRPGALPPLHSGVGSEDEDDFDNEDESPPALPRSALAGSGGPGRNKSTRIAGVSDVDGRQPQRLRVHWAKFRKRMGTGTAPSTSELAESTHTGGSSVLLHRPSHTMDPEKTTAGVDEVVVDRAFFDFDEIKSSVVSQSEGGEHIRNGPASAGLHGGTNTTEHDSLGPSSDGFWGISFPLVILRYRFWPAVVNFFTLSFEDPQSEDRYKKETWFLQKSLALWSSLFMILNWTLTTATLPPPVQVPDRIFFYGIAPAITFPLLPMVMWDWPRDRNWFYQIFVVVSVWSWTIFNLFSIYFCGFYIDNLPVDKQPYHPTISCGQKDFIGTLFFATALPTIALFGLKLKRLPQLIGVLSYFVIGAVLILQWKSTWYRNILQTMAFHFFLMWVHYMRENAERRLYVLRDQLKLQYKATQKAQINERKAADSKRRLTSYVFHEVRVPLNTALLAVQNMAAVGVFARSQDIEFKALEGSLSMMSKVLNDVLDFNRMDSGRFESVSKPFAFHMVMRSLFVPLRMATDARKLEFTTELDPAIDKLTRAAMYQALGESPAGVARRLAEADDADESGMVVGDEMRLRQIINNLASNACKFTPAGGRITIRTKLIWPTRLPEPLGGTVVPDANTPASDMTTPRANAYSATPHPGVQRNPLSEPNTPTVAKAERPPIAARSSSGAGSSATGTTTDTEAADAAALHDVLSANHLDQHNQRNTRPLGIEKIVVRIEVTDTGCGITSSDMVKNKLFSAFNQTEQGRQQGGKGTGLGLALVRQIVKRTGGRLGVSSAGSGQGSTFWVEMPLGCGSKAVVGGADRLHRLAKMDTPDEIDAALTEFTPAPPLAARKGPRRSSDLGPLAPAALENLMDQQGQMASLPSMTMESANPILSRMAIKETGGSPAPDAVSLNLMHPDDGAEPEPHGGMGASLVRDPPPPPIVLPPTSPALVLASARPANVSTPPPATPPSATITRTPAPPAPPFAQMPVLVVDDDSLTRMLMKRLLTRLGCKVTTAENGEAALAALTGSPRPTPQSEEAPPTPVRANTDEGGTAEGYVPEGTYAVVFLDNQMPVLSGLEAVRRLRQAGRSDFVVGVTGNALLSDQEDYLEAGADYVLTKPVLEKSLRGMLVLADEMRQQRPRRESKT